MFNATGGPVLALMGCVHSARRRGKRFVFLDVFNQRVGREDMKGVTDRDTMLGMAVCRTLSGKVSMDV